MADELKPVKATCIECKKKFTYIDDDFGPRMYQGVYNTGNGNDQMCIPCAVKRGFIKEGDDGNN